MSPGDLNNLTVTQLIMTNSILKAGRIPYLPNEILLEIFKYLPDLSTLYEIHEAIDGEAHRLASPAWQVLLPFVKRHPLQLQKLIKLAMCARSRLGKVPTHSKPLSSLDNCGSLPSETLDAWREHLRKISTRWWESARLPFMVLDRDYDPATMLREMSAISADMEQVVQSFVEVRLHGTHSKMKEIHQEEYEKRYRHCNGSNHSKAMHEKWWGPGYCLKQATATDEKILPSGPTLAREAVPPSATELHRIQRALWRLLIYSTLYHGPHPLRSILPWPRWKREEPYNFLQLLTEFEVEEVECVYRHLKEQIDLWADPGHSKYSPDLARRLLDTFGADQKVCKNPFTEECSNDGSTHIPPHENKHISHAFNYYRDQNCMIDRTTFREIPNANRPNAGWKYLHKNHEYFLSDDEFLCGDQAKGVEFLGWGYCMWDKSRLEDWWLIDRTSAHKGLAGKAKMEWWCHIA